MSSDISVSDLCEVLGKPIISRDYLAELLGDTNGVVEPTPNLDYYDRSVRYWK